MLPIPNLRAADLVNACCHIRKECYQFLRLLRIVPTLSQWRGFCELLSHHLVDFMEITVISESSGSIGRKEEDSPCFQPITCYVWFLPDAIPSQQSLKHFDPTKWETSEGAVLWQKCWSHSEAMLKILVLTTALPSPPLSMSVWRLLSVSTHLAGLRVEPILHWPGYQHCTVLVLCQNQCLLHPSSIHLPVYHPLHSILHTKPWVRGLYA